jgi:mannose-6-phosphate isomerase-like protein (cupin superfamily)
MKGFVDNIEKLTEDNDLFRKVLYTGHNLQLVVMAIQPGDEIGEEVHDDRDQFFRVEAGTGTITIDGVDHAVKEDDGIIVPQGARHNVTPVAAKCSNSTRSTGRPSISTARFTRLARTPKPSTNISTARRLNKRSRWRSVG